ncbi:MAG: SusC/RagA family TonB-linked outer membrane protein [Bacteroidales bacterium]|nr:SusC/RagA family TonB-linked outer membrane protein [Bacteroidales bacterium]
MLLSFFLSVFTIHVAAQKVTLSYQNVPFEKVLYSIKQQTGLALVFSEQLVDVSRKVSINATSIEVKEALKQLLVGTNVSFEIKNNKLYLVEKKAEENLIPTPVQKKITGSVADSKGEAIIGATVKIKGMKSETITDINGQFSLDVPENSVLTVSYIGYDTQEFRADGRTNIDITLKEDIKLLDEVVVVGYGTTLRKNLTTAVSTIKTENISKAANSNMSQLLLGRAAGLQASISSPQPGGNVSLSIRGAGTPIFVVDGVMMPSNSLEVGNGNIETPSSINRAGLAGLNPNDIESIEILKDASAAIYGIGAANGVILITTKKGSEGKPRITIENNYSMVRNYSYLQPLNAQEYMNIANVFSKENYLFNNKMYPYGDNSYDNKWAPEFTPRDIDHAQTTNWLDYILKPGSISNHNISVSGGSKLLRYYLSGNYYKQEGTVSNSSMERYALRTNISSQVLPFLKLTTILNVNSNQYVNSNADGGGAGGIGKDALQTALSYPSYLSVYDENGDYTRYRNYSNPVEMSFVNDRTKTSGWYLNMAADMDIIKNMLLARFMYGTNQENANRSLYIPSNIYYYEMTGRSRGHLGYADRNYQTIEATISFNKQFSDWLKTDAVAGMGLYYNGSDGMDIDYQNAKDNIGPDNIGGAEGPFYPTSFKSRNEKRSQFIRATFDVFDRYVLASTLRRDGTDKFFPGKKYALFPSVSFAWKLSNESLMKDISWIDQLKIRASYGQTGQDNLGTLLYGNYGPSSSYVRFSENSVTYIPYIKEGADYSDVTWEKTIMKNIGLDFSILHNRIWGSFDCFRNDVTDLLGTAPGEPLNMAGSRPFNYGHYYRTGWDATINSLNIEIPRVFKWTSRLTLTQYNLFWVEREPNYDYKEYQLRKNEPMNAYYYYNIAGIINMDKSNMPESQLTLPVEAQMPGYPIIKDRNSDGLISLEDIYMGNSTPDISIGFGNTFTYKNFDLDIFLYGQFGAERYNYAYQWALPGDLYYENPRNTNIYAYTLWNSQTNPNGTRRGIASTKAVSLPGGAGTSEDIQDASFVRIRNITLGYNLNGKKLGKSLGNYISNIRIFMDTQNPITLTKFAGVDPEIYIGNNSSPAGYPMTRIFSIGANINFN